MRDGKKIAVIIPALNEEASIGQVIDGLPAWVDDVVVGDNGSTDATPKVAREHGARVVIAPRKGYGTACQAAIAALKRPDIVVFIDADRSDYPEQMDRLVDPIIRGEARIAIGSRVLGECEPGALTPQQRWGNWLATRLIRLFWGMRFTDLGPFRAIDYKTLCDLAMCDADWGWTVEMQIKAARDRIPAIEAPVNYRKRIGRSKISGTVRGVIAAGAKILSTIFKAAMQKRPSTTPQRLIVFLKYPTPGAVKTRLAPTLGEDGAAALHRRMTERTLDWARRFCKAEDIALEVRYSGASRDAMRAWLGSDLNLKQQGDGDLGVRMQRAFREAFAAGNARVTIIGTDCPALNGEHVQEAFDQLGTNDLVLGPATDGGYYLIALRRHTPALFQEIGWGGSRVLGRTRELARAQDYALHELEPLDDIDRPEDLAQWQQITGEALDPPAPGEFQSADTLEQISVIIPTLDEEAELAETLHSLQSDNALEILVVDGGSRDATRSIAARGGALVIDGPENKALQMNQGAWVARGDILLFLHADTWLPADYDRIVRQLLSDPNVAAGSFRFAIRGDRFDYRVIEWVTNLRARLFGLPYGDQALFMKAENFHAVGGFPDIPIMEDYEIVRRLKKYGKVVTAAEPAHTSPRRWRSLGPIHTTLTNQLMLIGYRMGVSPSRLVRWYDRRRGLS